MKAFLKWKFEPWQAKGKKTKEIFSLFPREMPQILTVCSGKCSSVHKFASIITFRKVEVLLNKIVHCTFRILVFSSD